MCGSGLHRSAGAPIVIVETALGINVIPGLVQVLFFQGLGEIVSKFLLPTLPGPVIGLVLLIAFLVIRGKVDASLALVADGFSQYFGLLFVPAAVGVVLFLPQLRANAWAIVCALVGSVALTIAGSALIARVLSRDRTSND
jgi:holin-like protein